MSNVKEDNIVLYEEGMSVKAFADALGVSLNDIIKKLMSLGLMLSMNEVIDFENAEIVALDYNKTLKKKKVKILLILIIMKLLMMKKI